MHILELRLEKNKTLWGYHAVADDDKLELKQYIVLMKRTNTPISKEALDLVIKGKMAKDIEKMGVTVDFNLYVHGDYDLIMCTTTKNIKLMKKFCEILNGAFNKYIDEIRILEVIFPITKNGFTNPKIEELRDYFLPG